MDAACQLADQLVASEEEEYCNDNLLGTNRDVVVDSLAENKVLGRYDEMRISSWHHKGTFSFN